jgi:hypothetical protein
MRKLEIVNRRKRGHDEVSFGEGIHTHSQNNSKTSSLDDQEYTTGAKKSRRNDRDPHLKPRRRGVGMSTGLEAKSPPQIPPVHAADNCTASNVASTAASAKISKEPASSGKFTLPPPPKQRAQSKAFSVNPQPPPPPLPPAFESKTKCKSGATLYEDTQPGLTEADALSFGAHRDDKEEHIEEPLRGIWRRFGFVIGITVVTVSLLLIAIGLLKEPTPFPGLQFHLVLSPDSNHSKVSLDQARLRQFWLEKAPSQVVELYNQVESMNLRHRVTVNIPNQLLSAPSNKLSTNGNAPMCMSFFVQSALDLASNIQVSFPDVKLHNLGRKNLIQIATTSESTNLERSRPTTDLVLESKGPSSALENHFLSRLSGFPISSWKHGVDRHVLMSNEALTDDSQILSLEIRPCNDNNKKQHVVEGVKRVLKGTSDKIQHGADKIKDSVQGTSRKLKQGVTGIKQKTGNLVGKVASWHTTKKWL